MLIQAKKLSKHYGAGAGKITALNSVDLTIQQGDFISIMGPSGSGKSTLLHLLSGLDAPSGGKVCYDGADLYAMSDSQLSALRRRTIGFVFQQFNLLPVLTAWENIALPVLLDKRQPDEAYLFHLAEMLDIRARLAHLPHELSGGQQQRVAIARALAADPQVIFADEPTGNLDTRAGGEVMHLLCTLQKELNKTLVVITHDSHVAAMAARRFCIVDGALSEVSGV